ncbi:MAG: glycosyltransferase [Deltaproteobacteria bacterium]|nr:glycosyltransferase [Deltaproteobacteria bacterium]
MAVPAARAEIAVFIHSPSGGGAQRRTVTLVNGFAEAGHRVELVVVTASGPLRPDVSPRVRVVELTNWHDRHPLARLPRRVQLFLALPALARYFRLTPPQVFLSAASHVHVPVLLAHRWARSQVPVVLRMSNHLTRTGAGGVAPNRRVFARRLARKLYPDSKAVIAVSQGVADDLVHSIDYPQARVHTIYSPILTDDLRERAQMPLDHPWFAAGQPPVVLGVGRLVKQKDFPTLVRAFAMVRAVRPLRLLILGRAKNGKRLQSLTELINELGVAADVQLAGYVSNPAPYMKHAAMLALSSAWEGLPGVLMEALACGCPIVSTDCPSGPSEILDGGRFGRLVAVGDDAALARAITETLDDPPDRQMLLARAEDFGSERSIASYLELLLRVKDTASSPSAAADAVNARA